MESELYNSIKGQHAGTPPQDSGACQVKDPVDAGELIILIANEMEAIVQPLHALIHLPQRHPLSTASCIPCIEERLPPFLFKQLSSMISHLHGKRGSASCRVMQ
jgi:hypothetical protein